MSKNWLLSTLVKKNLPEAKLKSFRLMVLAEEISTQPGIDCVMWLLVVTLMHNENEEAIQGKIENVV